MVDSIPNSDARVALPVDDEYLSMRWVIAHATG
jgi:hypothetical protein